MTLSFILTNSNSDQKLWTQRKYLKNNFTDFKTLSIDPVTMATPKRTVTMKTTFSTLIHQKVYIHTVVFTYMAK